MPDIDRLIEAWNIFRNSNPYEICDGKEFRAIKEPEYCMGQMIKDTITILKEQEAVKPKHNPLSPTNWFCGKCGMCISRFHDYCPSCGREVKWE